MITVFTPTYNRKKLLKRCYESLEKQCDKSFKWLVIDDGSIDGTKDLIKKLQKKSSFEIDYYYRDNGGKHRAWNMAVEHCSTDYLLILDSDDVLTDDAIAILNTKCGLIKNNDKICGIIGNRGLMDKKGVIGVRIPDVEYASGLELYQKMNFKGDTLRLYKTAVLRRYLFPEVSGENFMSENVIFDKIDQNYKMLVISDVIYLCEYQDSGLTRNLDRIRLENPVGNALALKSAAETALSFKKRFGITTLYIMWTRRFHIVDAFRSFKRKKLYIICYPVSFVFQLLRFPKFYYRMFSKEGHGEK